MNEFLGQEVETVITVCGYADQACPIFPGQVNRYHWPFEDPAHVAGTDAEKMAVFRRVRDEIRRVFEAYAAERKPGEQPQRIIENPPQSTLHKEDDTSKPAPPRPKSRL